MTIQDEVIDFVRANPGVKWGTIKTYFVQTRGYNPYTIEGAIKRCKVRFPELYHPGLSQTEYNMSLQAPGKIGDLDEKHAFDNGITKTDISGPVNSDLSEVSSIPGKVNKPLPDEDSITVESRKYVENCSITTIQRPPDDIEFGPFVAQYGYPRYGGLFMFQTEIFDYIWDSQWSMINVPRDHGKSIFLGFLCQWAMDIKNWDILYLGWTDRRKEIAEFVYAYFVQMNLIASAKTKVSSTMHFQILNGCKFDTYRITAKEVLGMHAMGETLDQGTRKMLMIIDDPIDETFREERHKETRLETKWRSTISNINPNKVIFVGTKKFEEDFFYFIKRTYKTQGLVHYLRRTHLCTPNIADLSLDWGNLNHLYDFEDLDEEQQTLLMDKARLDPCFNPDIQFPDLRFIYGAPPEENILCPERWTEEKLKIKREEVGEYWWNSEYEQNPHPITGEVWEDLQYIKTMDSWQMYDMGMIIVDSATASDAKKAQTPAKKKLKAISFTGIVIVLRHVETLDYHVVFDLTGNYNFETKMKTIEDYFRLLRSKNYNMKVKVVIEKQGGGDDIVSSAQVRREYTFGAHIIDIHNARDKIMRIDDYLRIPINKGQIKFLFNIRYSELVNEILNFPYCEKFDAIDALATGIHEYENHIMRLSKEEVSDLVDKIRQRRISRYEKDWTRRNQTPWLKPTSARSRRRRSNVF